MALLFEYIYFKMLIILSLYLFCFKNAKEFKNFGKNPS